MPITGKRNSKAEGKRADKPASSRARKRAHHGERGALAAPKWYDPNADNPPWIRALADVRHMAAREGYCFHHVQAIIVSIDQYAEAALGNRGYFQALWHRWAER